MMSMLTETIQRAVRAADDAVARVYLSCCREQHRLLTFLFHSLFRDEGEIGQNLIDPLDRTTVAQFRQLIAYYLEHGYRFITPADILAGRCAGQKCAMITFDDGYFNNSLALPVLEEFHVPALLFVSTDNVRQGKCFWWDVLYRQRIAQGAGPREVYDEALAMKSLPTEEIERQLVARFGPDALVPRGDIDRPFSPPELREFARHPLVHLGNHTANHAILTNYNPTEAREQIVGAQQWLQALTGEAPVAIAYPNGGYDDQTLAVCAEAGLKLGFTVRPRKNRMIPGAGPVELMQLGRFVPHAGAPIATQCRTYRSDLQLYSLFRAMYLGVVRGTKPRVGAQV